MLLRQRSNVPDWVASRIRIWIFEFSRRRAEEVPTIEKRKKHEWYVFWKSLTSRKRGLRRWEVLGKQNRITETGDQDCWRFCEEKLSFYLKIYKIMWVILNNIVTFVGKGGKSRVVYQFLRIRISPDFQKPVFVIVLICPKKKCKSRFLKEMKMVNLFIQKIFFLPLL